MAFQTDFYELDISTSKYQKTFYILCAVIISPSDKISFWYLLVLYVNFSVKCLKFAPKWSLSYLEPILAAIFVTIAMVKIESIPALYTWAIVLIN